MKQAFLAACLILLSAWFPHGSPLGTFTLKIGAGGWLVGIDVNADGTRLARTDTYGAYIWRMSGACNYSLVAAPCWDQLKVQSSMPGAYFGYVGSGTSQVQHNGIAGSGGGVYEIASAPSNSAIIYMMVDGWIFKSINKGATFNVTGTGSGTFFNSASTPVSMSSNGANRMCGRKMAVDPINPNIVYAGTDVNGLFVSIDGGASWSAVSGVPTGTGVVNYSIAFDPTSDSGGVTQTIYASTNGSTAGVYISINAGSTWTLTTSGPSTVCHMVVDQTGVVWATDGANGGANGSLWRLTSGTWVKLTGAGNSVHSVAVDPTDATHVVAVSTGGVPATTVNATAGTPTWATTGAITRTATDVPWLAAVNESFMSNGDTIFDATNCSGGAGSCTLVFGEGIGVWTANPPNSTATVNWTSASAGIEQLVSRDVIAPNGVAVTGVSDRANWYLPTPNGYPSNYNAPYNDAFSLNVAWALDWASSNSSFVAGIIGDINSTTDNNSGFSTDGGQTWKQFNSYYQDIAASATANNGSGAVRVTLPTTTGLNTWSAGTSDRTTIVRVVSYNGAVTTLRRYWPITVVDGTHIDLQGSTYASNQSSAGRYEVYVDTNPLTDNDGNYAVTGTASGTSGRIKISVTATSGAMADGTIVCLNGVGGTTEANGCWVSIDTNNGTNSFDLYGSTYVNAWTSGGTANKTIPPGGAVAVSTPLNMIMMGSNQDYPQCTTDGGLTWTGFKIGSGGWINASFLNRHPIAADRVTPNTFYMYNSSTGTYLVTNCGTPTLQSATIISNSNSNANLRSVPGYAGHLFFAIGSQGAAGAAVFHPQGGALRRSADGGQTWQAIATTAEPKEIAVGAVAPGSDYPTVYMVGWVNNVYGLWRTTATASQWASGSGTGTSVVWTQLQSYPLGSMDSVTALAADQIIWNKWYLGFNGSGFVYGQQSYLLNRDLNPVNDNSPVGLPHVA